MQFSRGRSRIAAVVVAASLATSFGPFARVGAAPPGNSPNTPRYSYTVTNLGQLQTGGFSTAEDINAAGDAVGIGVADANYQAALFQDGNAIQLAPGQESQAFGLNDLGQVVGVLDDLSPRAFIWLPVTENGIPSGAYEMGTLGGIYSTAADINNAEQAVGGASTLVYGLSGPMHAFLWRQWELQDLGTLGGLNSIAAAINEIGHVAGHSDTADNRTHAFFWTPQGGMIDLGTLGGPQSFGFDVNDSDVVVGYSLTDEVVGEAQLSVRRAFAWRNGEMMSLGTLPIGPLPGGGYGPDHVHSIANGINNSGDVVGYSFPANKAWIWRNGKMQDLNRLIRPGSGWILTNAKAINDAGQIVGVGYLNGQTRAFLLTPVSGSVGH